MKKLKPYFSYFVILLVLTIGGYFTFKKLLTEDSGNDYDQLQSYLIQSQNYREYPLQKSFEIGLLGLESSRKLENDTFIVEFCLVLGKNLSFQGKNKEALHYFENALKTAQNRKLPKGECSSLIEIGILHYDWGNYDTSYKFFDQALKFSELCHLKDEEAIANNYIGKYYHTIGKFSVSVEYYHKAVDLYQQLGNLQQSASVLLSLGKTYMNEGNFHRALECYLDAYKKGEILNDKITYADVCNHLGSIYLLLNQPDKSFDYHKKALGIRAGLGNTEGMAKSFNNIGETFLHIGAHDSALQYFNMSYDICLKTSYKKGTVKALTNIGKTKTLQKQFRQGVFYLEQSYAMASQSNYDAGIAESSLALGNNLLAQQKFDDAIPFFENCLTKALSSSLTELALKSANGLYQCYLDKGNISLALKYFIQYSELERNRLYAESNRQLAELRVTFDSERKEKDIEFLKKENELNEMSIKRKSALLWLCLIAFSFAVSLCFFIYSRFQGKSKANKELQQLNAKITEQYRELEKLNKELEKVNGEKDKFFSIVAHELRNPLFWFQNLAEVLSVKFQTMSPEKMKKSLMALDESAKNAFHLMDNLLQWSRSRLNRITPKIAPQQLDTLIQESTRMFDSIIRQKEIELITDIPSGIMVKADSDLFTCVVRNIISNAIKFTPSGGFILVNCSISGSDVKIGISDSGIGIPDKQLSRIFDSTQVYSSSGLMEEKGSGLGLKLCKEFIELNGGKIWVNSTTGKGTSFEFTVPGNFLWNEVLC